MTASYGAEQIPRIAMKWHVDCRQRPVDMQRWYGRLSHFTSDEEPGCPLSEGGGKPLLGLSPYNETQRMFPFVGSLATQLRAVS
jgi:hypothetical protein